MIGNSLPLSGTSKSLGESGQKASELAGQQIEDAVGSVDAEHTVRLVDEDQGSDAGTATASVKNLVEGDRATCVTGPWSSEAVAQAAREVTIPGEVLEITPVATGDDVADLDDNDLVDSTALPVSTEGDALATAIDGDLGGAQENSVSVASSSNTYGDTLSQDFIEDWQGEDGTVSEHTVLPAQPLSTSSAYSGLTYQITSDSPDAILLIDNLDGFSQLAPALDSSDTWDPSIAWGSDQLVQPDLPDEVGSAAVEGMRALAPGTPDGDEPASAFAEDFESAAPRQVKAAPFAAQEFDATILCYLAAVAAGSTEGRKMADALIDITAPGGTEYSWRQLPNAIRALEDGEDINYTGASGPLDMDVHGNPTNGVFDMYEYDSAGLKVVGEVPVEKPNPATP